MTANLPLSAIAAGLAAWVREGDEPDLPPRLDQAVQAFAARYPEMAHQMDLRRGKLPAVTQEEAR